MFCILTTSNLLMPHLVCVWTWAFWNNCTNSSSQRLLGACHVSSIVLSLLRVLTQSSRPPHELETLRVPKVTQLTSGATWTWTQQSPLRAFATNYYMIMFPFWNATQNSKSFKSTYKVNINKIQSKNVKHLTLPRISITMSLSIFW